MEAKKVLETVYFVDILVESSELNDFLFMVYWSHPERRRKNEWFT